MDRAALQGVFQKALQHQRALRLGEAERLYRELLAELPNDPGLHINFAGVLEGQGKIDAAIVAYESAIRIKPDCVEAFHNLGGCLQRLNRLNEALAAYRQALAIRPNLPETLNNLAYVLMARGQTNQALETVNLAIQLAPNWPVALTTLGALLAGLDRVDEAIAVLQRALAADPSSPGAYLNLGNAMRKVNRLDEAAAAYRHAIGLRPDFAEAVYSLGAVLGDLGRHNEAVIFFERASVLQPDSAQMHCSFAWALMISEDFKRGWPEYEWRLQFEEWTSRFAQWASSGFKLSKPRWSGEDLAGRRILLLAEPGLGDTFQFVRYLPMVAARGGRPILACGPEQVRLFQCFKEYASVTTYPPSCEFDVYCPLGSLPKIFETTLESIPASAPYLWPDDRLVEKWKARMPANQIKVGLIWSGNVGITARRAIELRQLAPLFSLPGLWFVSLQKGKAALQAKAAPELPIADWGGELTDFAETAALMLNLDLIISTDTSTAHLAGALGRPVWTLLPFATDWRWLVSRTDSPWYPTMRLFRQPAWNDWQTPIEQAANALRMLIDGR